MKKVKHLSISDVLKIRESKEPTSVLSKKFSKCPRQIRYIRAKKSWRLAID